MIVNCKQPSRCAISRNASSSRLDASGLALPGDFDTSASTLFGGATSGVFAGDKSWAQEVRNHGISVDEMGLREQEARIKFSTGIAALGTDK